MTIPTIFPTTSSAGSNLLNVAENQATLQIAEATQLAGKPLTLIGTLVYVGDRSGQFGHPTFELPSYTTLRVAADYQVSESLGVSAEINNLFDEDFYTNSYSTLGYSLEHPPGGAFQQLTVSETAKKRQESRK